MYESMRCISMRCISCKMRCMKKIRKKEISRNFYVFFGEKWPDFNNLFTTCLDFVFLRNGDWCPTRS